MKNKYLYLSQKNNTDGFVLLEVLVGMLIFSLAILGLIAFQAFAAKSVVDSRFRTEAVGYADELIGLMSTSAPASVAADFSTSGAKLLAWKTARLDNLPSSTVATTITALTDDSGAVIVGQYEVTIAIGWTAPGQGTGRYTVDTVIF